MSQIPDIRRILTEDLVNPDENLLKVIESLNRFMETSYDALTSLTFQDNFLAKVKDIPVAALSVGNGKFPIIIKHDLGTKVQGVLVMSAIQTNNPYFSSIGSAVGLDWRQEGLNIVLENISGLDFTNTDNTYTIKVLVV